MRPPYIWEVLLLSKCYIHIYVCIRMYGEREENETEKQKDWLLVTSVPASSLSCGPPTFLALWVL